MGMSDYRAKVKVKGITGYAPAYRKTPHSAVNAAFRSVIDSPWKRAGKAPFEITLDKRIDTGRVLSKTFKWVEVCTLLVHEGTLIPGFHFFGTDPRGREFMESLPLPKWENPGSNIIQG
jgi:hypothetical protein